ncbi:NUC173-domain-containing protein [Lenzites betulinus]|nr:NUC173-domain-containing protein [Lenzites betulinus]
MADNVETVLCKIRPHTTSALAHQKAPATLLRAIEATFREQNTEPSATAYFAALLTTLDGALQASRTSGPAMGDGDIVPAVLYLLAAVIPCVPHPVIRTNLSTTLSLTSPLFPVLSPHAPPLRSQITLYGAVLHALDRPHLDAQGLRQAFMSIIQLTLDPRPKVRKKAAEVVKDVLAAPPLPLAKHPYADKVAEWVKAALTEISSGGLPKFKGKKADTEGSEAAIHLLAFLRPVLPTLPAESLSAITSSLLLLPRLGNPYLSQSAYSILSDLLSLSLEDPTVDLQSHMSELLKVILSSPPIRSDAALNAAWATVLGNTMLAYHHANADECVTQLNKVWKALWTLLESSDGATRKSAAQALAKLGQCFTPATIKAAVKEKESAEPKAPIRKIVHQTAAAFESLTYAPAIPEVLSVISSLIENLRFRNGTRRNSTAAEQLLLPLIAKIASLRVQKTFEHKEAADATLGTAMRILGPEVVLRALPLNLEAADRQAGLEPRAFLLPLLAQPHSSPLGHFVSYFVPLTERMFDLQTTADAEGRSSEAKVWSVLVEQIWMGLPGYCWGSIDLKDSLTAQFSQLLSQLLYGQPGLRPPVLRALKIMVDSNVALASGDPDKVAKLPQTIRVDAISEEDAQANVEFLRTQAESWLAVLFNVFSSVGRDNQGMVGDVVGAWIAIADPKEVTQAYHKLVGLFKQNLAKAQNTSSSSANKGTASDSMTAVTQDLLLLVLPYLSMQDATELLNLYLTAEVLESRDNGVQKRGYKTLARLVESGKVQIDAAAIFKTLEGLTDGLTAAAKKDRFHLLTGLVQLIPSESLHIIPSLIPEAVLGTKEPSEKARNVAFDLVVAMGKKMAAGGVVKRNLVEGMDEDGAEAGDATANIEEYMTMIAGGLAGATPHMISATITAISRLLFEFRDTISSQMQTEIFTTLLVFVGSANREIVKSALGFVKLSIHTLPAELLRPHLKDIVPTLLRWSHDHKNHFKAKVRHIFERMLRRFGWEDVYAFAQEEDARKVLVNIKKRKDRAKRKRANAADDEDDVPKAKPAAGDAFEDVLYGSESELDDSDGEDAPAQNALSKRKAKDGGARLRADNDEPMDLLSGAASRVTTANAGRRKKPGQEAARFKTEEDTGKMVIDEDSDDEAGAATGGDEVAGEAYRETLTSVDGFTRGPNGKVKFNKDTKKRRREAEADEDVEMADGDAGQKPGKKSKKKAEGAKFGQEFKAKKAGGDVKKNGVDPYAYMSLSQAAKKQNRGARIGIAGKR